MSKETEKVTMVYIVQRWQQIIGCYANMEDAVQVQRLSIEKGQVCDLIVKPLLNSLQNG